MSIIDGKSVRFGKVIQRKELYLMGKSCGSQFRRLVAASSLVIASLALTLILGPEFSTAVDATTNTGACQTISGVVTCGVEAEVRVNVNSVLTLGISNDGGTSWTDGADTMSDPLELNLGSAIPGGAAVRNSVLVKTTTNNASGYNLTLAAETANPYLFDSNETSVATPTKPYFSSELVTGESTDMDLTATVGVSRWGYSLSDAAGAVSVIPGSSDTPAQLRPNANDTNAVNLDDEGNVDNVDGDPYTGEPAVTGSTTTVYFFAKADSGMRSGTYSNDVVFTATAAP